MFSPYRFKSHYFRVGRAVSCLAAGLALAAVAGAQYPGQVAQKAPVLRAVGVLEWVGAEGKPNKARLIPITVFDGADLNDGSIYLARPQPLGLSSAVEYELKRTGKNIGLFDIQTAGQEQGFWVGYGTWKPMPRPKPDAPKPIALFDEDYSERPVLHRKHHADDPAQPGVKKDSKDTDEPTLHRADAGAAPAADNDPDRPTLRRPKTTAADDDPDRPKLKKDKKKTEDVGHVEDLPGVTDPDRPKLKRGKSEGVGSDASPGLTGVPVEMEQAVAVSDGRDLPEHPWTFHWANHDDELAMKAKLEDEARAALGLTAPEPAPAPAKTAKTKAGHAKARLTLPPEPAALAGEKFHVFELAYGAGATLVLTAQTDAPAEEQKFVTLVAQPDFYGGLSVLLKQVTDARHLDDTPRLRLVDAVDAEADNRGDLLFEARGATARHFVLYRIYRGRAEAVFTSAPISFAVASR